LVGFHPPVCRPAGGLGLAPDFTYHHASDDTTTESAFNPLRRIGTQLTHLPKLVVLDLSLYGLRRMSS
jgi:hypothetical protein